MTAAGLLYLRIWLLLLFLTVVMTVLHSAPVTQGMLVTLLVAVLLGKVSLIAGYFMHLRFEAVLMSLTVLIGLLLTGAILFLFIMPDAWHILSVTSP